MADNEVQQLNRDGAGVSADNHATNKKFNKIIDILLWVVIVILACAVLCRAFVYSDIVISGTSMMPTFTDEEVVGVSKVTRPNRGDVAVFYKKDGANKLSELFSSGKSGDDNEHSKLIKRVVALEGDKVWVELIDEEHDLYQLFIETPNGEILAEDGYVRDGEKLDVANFYIRSVVFNGSGLGLLLEHIGRDNAFTVPADCFYALGDNRSNSHDSRAFGAVPMSRLYGVVRPALIYTSKQ